MADDIDLAIVTMRFDAADPTALIAVLSKYVVLTRMQPGCRNVDLCASVTQPGRYLLIQKWDDAAAQRAQRGAPDGLPGELCPARRCSRWRAYVDPLPVTAR